MISNEDRLSDPPVTYVTQEMWDRMQAELQSYKELRIHKDLLDAVEKFIHAYKPLRREGISEWSYCDICLSREDKFHSPSCEYAKLRSAFIEAEKMRHPVSASEP